MDFFAATGSLSVAWFGSDVRVVVVERAFGPITSTVAALIAAQVVGGVFRAVMASGGRYDLKSFTLRVN